MKRNVILDVISIIILPDNALRSGDLDGCAKYLDGVGNNADVAPLWRQLAERALDDENVQVILCVT